MEILKIFFVSLIALTTLILFIGVGRELVRRGLGVLAVIQLLPYVLPISLQFAFPATALFSVCSVYGRMSADGEVSTVKASGVSPLKILKPAFVFALLLSPIAVYVSDLAVSWGRPGVNRVVLMSIEDIAYRVLNTQHSYTSDHGFSIHVRDIHGKRLIHPTVTLQGKHGGKDLVKMTAAEGQLSLDAETRTLVLKVKDSQVLGGNKFESTVPGEIDFPIPLGSMSEEDDSQRRPSELPLQSIVGQTRSQQKQTRQLEGEMAAATGMAILSSHQEAISGESGRQRSDSLRESRKRLSRLQIEPWRRWAWGFSCLCFVMVGAPLAVIAKTGDHWTTFGMCFLPTLLIYYPLFIFGLEQAKDGNVPPYGVWVGNVVLMFVAGLLVAKVRRN